MKRTRTTIAIFLIGVSLALGAVVGLTPATGHAAPVIDPGATVSLVVAP